MITASQAKGHAAKKAKELVRLATAKDSARQGLSVTEAAKASGMTVAGFKSLLLRNYGTQSWNTVKAKVTAQ